jgi:chromosome segregation ATPase
LALRGRAAASAIRLNGLPREPRRLGGLERRVAELEGVLSAVREALVLQKREKSILEASLDRITGDNANLTGRLAAADTERNRLAIAVKEANERRQADVNMLNARLGTISARAADAENMLAEARQASLAHTAEASLAVTKLTEETAARHTVERKLEQLENALRAKESQAHDRERVHAELVERAGALVRTLEAHCSGPRRGDDQGAHRHSS